ncbi:MAG: type II secretion system F family protein [Aquificae bacterium]|nr:type II secretion system F family protein [Aquificota bacterium]
MPVFEYVALTPEGKRTRGTIEANDPSDAFKKLTQQRLVVVRIEPVSRKKKKEKTKTAKKSQPKGEKKSLLQMEINLNITIGSGVSSKDLSIVAKQLGALISAGVGIVDALELVADAIDNQVLKKALMEIAQEVREGTSLSKAMEKRKKIFGEFFVRMVEVGEETGALDKIFLKISEYYQRIAEIINKIKSASFYPTFVTLAAGGITLGIIYFLVPTFAQIYQSFGAQLPFMTQMLINASNWLQHYILQFLIGLVGFVVAFVMAYKKIYTFRKVIDFLKLKLPMFGALFEKGALAKFARTFATLFSAGVSIERALELSSKVMGNVIYEEALEKIRQEVMQGEPLWKAMEKTKRFPKMFIAMVKIGEETGQLDAMLESLADFYEDDVKTTIDGLISMIEPMMMMVIGGIVGVILMALYLPIFKIGSLIQS